MPLGDAKAALLTKAQISELSVIEDWLSRLKTLGAGHRQVAR
jgi:hypothetical protein